jgi:hypothetical protein
VHIAHWPHFAVLMAPSIFARQIVSAPCLLASPPPSDLTSSLSAQQWVSAHHFLAFSRCSDHPFSVICSTIPSHPRHPDSKVDPKVTHCNPRSPARYTCTKLANASPAAALHPEESGHSIASSAQNCPMLRPGKPCLDKFPVDDESSGAGD